MASAAHRLRITALKAYDRTSLTPTQLCVMTSQYLHYCSCICIQRDRVQSLSLVEETKINNVLYTAGAIEAIRLIKCSVCLRL
jgi:hypothetical protein